MLSSIANWAEDKATGYLKTGIQAGGSLAGNAVGGVGTLVENAGKSAAQGVQGGIGGVGNYINGYGNNIKRSMSADGPVSNAQKKTAVKASPPAEKPTQSVQKPLPSASSAKKILPAGPAPQKSLPPATKPHKSLPAPTQKPPSAPKATSQTPAAKSNMSQKSLPGRTPSAQNTKPSGPSTVKPKGPAGVSKPAQAATTTNAPKLVSSTNSSGKIVISPESRPKPSTGKTQANKTSSTSVKQTSDFLGIGDNFGDVSKTRPKPAQTKDSSAVARKASAADPLALGEEIGQIGKKK